MRAFFTALLAQVPTAAALCPLAELTRRGSSLGSLQDQDSGLLCQHRQTDVPPILDPLADVLSPLGLGGLLPRDSPRSEEHTRAIKEHIQSRLEEVDDVVDISGPILTPKAHRRLLGERDSSLLGGILAPLTGLLAALDIPTPQESGLKAIPGDDPSHQYIPPGPTDVRGCCPTLNTLANHGYISRDGITSFAEAANAVQIAYSLSYDTAIFVSAFGLLAGGDIPTGKFSIGGRDARVPETLGPAFGIDRHGTFEIDASPSRGDRYFGDNHSFNITLWNKLVSDANTYGDGLFNIDAMKRNMADSIETSRATNPEFTLGPNFGAAYATRAFIARPLSNGTNPNVPDFRNVAPFYLNETFPDNWYRIPNPYTLADLLADIGDLYLFSSQPLGTNYNGTFIPFNITIPDAAADIGCLGASLLASVAPDDLAEGPVQAVNALKDQIFSRVLGYASCNIADYDTVGGPASYSQPGENTDAGSGSGITHPGEFDSLSVRPSGLSAGQAAR